MGTDVNPPVVTDVRGTRVRYDPGPSGTAVAGLIIALIALALALYAAFAPREMVREGARAVTGPLERTAPGTAPARPAQPQARPQPQSGASASEEAQRLRDKAQEELQRQVTAVQKELSDLRQRLEQPSAAKPGQRTPGGKE